MPAALAAVLAAASRFGEIADEDAESAMLRMVTPVVSEAPCGNARSVENRIALAITAQSSRLRGGGAALDGTSLFALTAADFDAACSAADNATAVLAQSSSEASLIAAA